MKIASDSPYIVAQKFSKTPGPRTVIEGSHSGELFRKSYLHPLMDRLVKDKKRIVLDLDGTAGYGTSFLEEAFGGLIREDGFDKKTIKKHIELKSDEEDYLIDDIEHYMDEAQNER